MQSLIKKQIENGLGIFSICSSHPIVVEAACEFAMRKKRLLLIEATSNQVVALFAKYENLSIGEKSV